MSPFSDREVYLHLHANCNARCKMHIAAQIGTSVADKDPGDESGQTPSRLNSKGVACRRKFLWFFPKGFEDPKYNDWERGYKVKSHEDWQKALNQSEFKTLLRKREFAEIAVRAVRIESRTNLLFSFEKMALRDAVKSKAGAEQFATGLYQLLHGKAPLASRFERWLERVRKLPRKQTRVLTWPVVTVFGFIASPEEHIFLKPNVTRTAAEEYGFAFEYQSAPACNTYTNLLHFGKTIRHDLRDLAPKDQIDIQSFIWVSGSGEYVV